MKTNQSKPQTSKKLSLEIFTPLSRKQLKVIVGGSDPVTSRGTKTSSGE